MQSSQVLFYLRRVFISFSFLPFFVSVVCCRLPRVPFQNKKNSNHVFSPRQQLCSQTLCADSVKNRVPYCDVINSWKVKTFTQALSVVIAGMTRTVKKRHSDENPLKMFLMTPRLHIWSYLRSMHVNRCKHPRATQPAFLDKYQLLLTPPRAEHLKQTRVRTMKTVR